MKDVKGKKYPVIIQRQELALFWEPISDLTKGQILVVECMAF